MLYKEFASALVMSLIIVAFAIPLTELSGESHTMPFLMLCCMGIFAAGQFLLAGYRIISKMDIKLSLKDYPTARVCILFGLTIIYLYLLEILGFYLDSFIYFVLGSLIAQPMPITPKIVISRIAICFLCIAFLYGLFTILLTVQIPKGFLGF